MQPGCSRTGLKSMPWPYRPGNCGQSISLSGPSLCSQLQNEKSIPALRAARSFKEMKHAAHPGPRPPRGKPSPRVAVTDMPEYFSRARLLSGASGCQPSGRAHSASSRTRPKALPTGSREARFPSVCPPAQRADGGSCSRVSGHQGWGPSRRIPGGLYRLKATRWRVLGAAQ